MNGWRMAVVGGIMLGVAGGVRAEDVTITTYTQLIQVQRKINLARGGGSRTDVALALEQEWLTRIARWDPVSAAKLTR